MNMIIQVKVKIEKFFSSSYFIGLTEILARISIGYVFIESGVGKLKDIPKVVEYFQSLNIPMAEIQAPMVSTMELLFGIFILVGFLTRVSAFFLIGIMSVALLTAKLEDITSFSDLVGMIEFLYILILFWLLSRGSQAISIDKKFNLDSAK